MITSETPESMMIMIGTKGPSNVMWSGSVDVISLEKGQTYFKHMLLKTNEKKIALANLLIEHSKLFLEIFKIAQIGNKKALVCTEKGRDRLWKAQKTDGDFNKRNLARFLLNHLEETGFQI